MRGTRATASSPRPSPHTAQTSPTGSSSSAPTPYRPDGYLTEIRELSTGTRRFALDPIGRVTDVQAHGWSERYAYDRTGNQTHADAPHHPTTGERSYDGALIRRAGRTTYEHDAAGRLIRRTRKLLNGQARTWTYTWNGENRLTRATTPDGGEWTYAYDPLGRRVSKTGPDGAVLAFAWDGTALAEQSAPDDTTTTWDYAPGTHRPMAQSVRRTAETDTTVPPTGLQERPQHVRNGKCKKK
ncbi:hypothetical protein JCM13580A_42180 [Streptomyces drozdowiczii]|uniref:RHS repeat domain-containing protein n=1 Tax=Streptomyces drozdowiczii TaxID=202862 RepID=UPI0031E86D23